MKSKSILGKSFVATMLMVVLGWAVYSIAAPAPQQSRRGQEQLSGFSYAQLTFTGEEQVTWDFGGNVPPRTRTLGVTYRELGGNLRATEINLLNLIGQDGWELVQADNNVRIFKKSN